MPPLLTWRYLPPLLGVLSASLLRAMAIVLTAIFVQSMFDQLLGSAGSNVDWLPLAGLLGFAVLSAGSLWLQHVAANRLGNDYVHDLRLLMYDGMVASTQRPEGYRKPGHGIQVVRFSSDLTAIQQWIALGISRAVAAVLFLAGALAAIAWLHPTIAVLVGFLLCLAVAGSWWSGIRLERGVVRTRRQRGRLANLISDTVHNLPQLALFGRTDRERKRIERYSERLRAALRERAFWTSCLRAGLELCSRLNLLVVIIVGSLALQDGDLTAGSIVALVSVTALVGTPVRHLGRVLEYWKGAKVAQAKIEPLLLRSPPQTKPTTTAPPDPGRVNFRNVGFGALKMDSSWEIAPRERVAVCAENGAGKSTLLSLLAGRIRPASGEILVDGLNPADTHPEHRARCIGVATADQRLMAGSLGKNLRMRIPGAGPESVEAACRLAGLDSFVAALPEGLKTRLGAKGLELSSGQQARVKLACAILGNPRLVLFDELDSALDPEGQRLFQHLLNSYPGTIVFVTHNPRFLVFAHRIWTIRSGEIQEDQFKPNHYEVVLP